MIPRGGRRDGWIWVSVNGVEQWIRAGETTTAHIGVIEVLDHAGINYLVVAEDSNGTKPAWVSDLEARFANGAADTLVLYNMAAGGIGQGWDGINQRTLTLAETFEPAPFTTSHLADNIVDGVGLAPASDGNYNVTIDGLIPHADLVDGVTTFIEMTTNGVAVTNSTAGWGLCCITDLPDQNNESGIEPRWITSSTDCEVDTSNADGAFTINDTIAKPTMLRAAANVYPDGSDLEMSVNGRSVVTGPQGTSAVASPTAGIINNHDPGGSDTPVYVTIFGWIKTQPAANLPTPSALP